MTIDRQAFPFPLSSAFVAILENEILKAGLQDGCGAIINFRDSNYSSETGGFHPVEISISSCGRIEYVTDFAFVGTGPFTELAKEIDFDISLGLFQHFGREYHLASGKGLFAIWQKNFVTYHRMGVYSVTVQEA
jgi:hypothetical protein